MLNGIHIADFVAACVELDAILARPREVGILSGPAVEAAGIGGSPRGVDLTDALAWPGDLNAPASELPWLTDWSPVATQVAYGPASGTGRAAAPAEACVVAFAERPDAYAAVLGAGDQSAHQASAIAHTKQLQATTRAFMRRHPDSRGPSPTEPPV